MNAQELADKFAAKIAVAALLFDYVLTGPLSSVVAGQYLAGFIQDAAVYLHRPFHSFHGDAFAAVFGILVTIYFWHKNTQGMHESSTKAHAKSSSASK